MSSRNNYCYNSFIGDFDSLGELYNIQVCAAQKQQGVLSENAPLRSNYARRRCIDLLDLRHAWTGNRGIIASCGYMFNTAKLSICSC